MTGYKALYTVPKQSFHIFLKYQMGTFPNLKSLSVDQLNFNEAKKLEALHQNDSSEKQKPLSFHHDNTLTQRQINFYQDDYQQQQIIITNMKEIDITPQKTPKIR